MILRTLSKIFLVRVFAVILLTSTLSAVVNAQDCNAVTSIEIDPGNSIFKDPDVEPTVNHEIILDGEAMLQWNLLDDIQTDVEGCSGALIQELTNWFSGSEVPFDTDIFALDTSASPMNILRINP